MVKATEAVPDSTSLWTIGKVVSVSMKNFLTYKDCSVSFDPCLNVIIGPNGTGKSSIVCAICLALNGKPRLLGRSTDEREYIKYGSQSTWLKIELFNPEGPNFVVERTVRAGMPKNSWEVNGKAARAEQIENLKIQLKIQIDNLCQFLPQDRVQAFSAMNDIERLESSMNSIDPELKVKHEKLKVLTVESTSFEQWKVKTDDLISQCELEIQTFQPMIDKWEDRKQREYRLDLLEQRKLFIIYDNELREYETLRQQKKTFETEVKETRQVLKPIEESKEENLRKALTFQKESSQLNKSIQVSVQNTTKFLVAGDQLSNEQSKVSSIFEQKQRDELKRKETMKHLKDEIQLVQKQISEVQSPEEAQKQLQEVELKLKEIETREVPLKEERRRREIDLKSARGDLESLQRVLHNYKLRAQEREHRLAECDHDVYKAYKYVKDHENLFEHEFAYPMFLSLNVHDKSKAKQIENHIQKRDMFAFIFAEKSDLDKFSSIINDTMKLKVASLLAPSSEYLPRFQAETVANEVLQQLGCQGVLLDFIEGPLPVKLYLQKVYFFHKTPVGKKFTDDQIGKLLQKFSIFYSEDRRFQSKKSKYTGEMSTLEIMLRDVQFLKDTIDIEQKAMIEQQIEAKLPREAECKEAVEKINAFLAELEEERDVLTDNRNKLKQTAGLRRRYETALEVKMRKLQDCKVRQTNWKDFFGDTVKEFVTRRSQKIGMLENSMNAIEASFDDREKSASFQFKEQIYHFSARVYDQELKLKSESNSASEQQLKRISEELGTKKNHVRCCWVKALKGAKLDITLQEKPPELMTRFESNAIPDQLDLVESGIEEERSKIQDIEPVDNEIEQKYDKAVKRRDDLENQKRLKTENQQAHNNRVDKLKRDWLKQVNSFIEKLDSNFSRFMQELNCNGQVVLSHKGDENDFAKYGLSIKVSYRALEQARELKREYQSGGEKSVATMLYLLALQELSANVPFRIVDEINQGMDSHNERRVFDMIVDAVSSAKKTSQYLFITPKLLLDLSYKPNMQVLTVFNGPNNKLAYDHWKISRFIRRHSRLEEA